MAHEKVRNPLRNEAERLLGAGLKLSRNTALYYAPYEGEVPASEWFQIEALEQSLELRPTEVALRAFEAWIVDQFKPDALGDELLRRRAETVTRPELDLFILGIKQLELHAAPMAWLMYDKRLRQLSADCLREGRGGGALFACWACMMRSIKGGTR